MRVFARLGVLGLLAFGTTFAGPVSLGSAQLLGSNEVPSNPSTATGFATVWLDGNLLTVDVNWQNLTGGTPSAAHIHCCTPQGTNTGVAVGFTGFPASLSGTYTNTFDLLNPAVYTSSFLNNFGGGTAAGAESALLAGIANGQAYVNIHNATYPGGEIRGFLVPEPASLALMGLGIAAIGFLKRRRSA